MEGKGYVCVGLCVCVYVCDAEEVVNSNKKWNISTIFHLCSSPSSNAAYLPPQSQSDPNRNFGTQTKTATKHRLPGPQTPSFWNLSHWWGLLFSVPPETGLPAPVCFLDDWLLHFGVLSGSLSSSAFYFILGSCLQLCLDFTSCVLPHPGCLYSQLLSCCEIRSGTIQLWLFLN